MSKYSLQWTEKTAESYCLEFMNTSKVAMLCSEIPSIDFQGTINNCVADIMVNRFKRNLVSYETIFYLYDSVSFTNGKTVKYANIKLIIMKPLFKPNK